MSARVRRRDDRGGAWFVYFEHKGKRWNKRVGVGPEAEARARATAQEFNDELDAARVRDEALYPGGPAPFETIAAAWWDAKAPSMPHSTIASKRCVIYARLIPYFRQLDVRRIDDDRVTACAVHQAELGHARETVETTGSVLDSVLSWAVAKGYADRVPALRTQGGKGVRSIFKKVAGARCRPAARIEAWTRHEVATILACAAKRGDWLADPLLFLFQTGCRRGEMLALEWGDVDLDARLVVIRQSLTRGQLKTTKADKVRSVILADEVRKMLLRRRFEGPKSGRVFRDRAGDAWTDHSFSGYWIRARREAAKLGVRKLKLHCTRHTWASWALAAGHDAAWCAAQIGDTLQVFLGRYVHAIQGTPRSLDFLRISPRAGELRPGSGDPPEIGPEVGPRRGPGRVH